MRTIWALAVCALCAAGAGCAQKTSPAPAPAAEVKTEVEALLKAQAQDWSAGRLEAFCAVYADDALFISPQGLTRGRAAILARYDKRYRQDGAEMGTLTLDVVETRATPDGAAVALVWRLAFSDGKTAEGHSLVTLRRGSNGWQIVQDASM